MSREEFLTNRLAERGAEVERLKEAMAEIWDTAHIPTPRGTSAYTHFQRDFDKIRALSNPTQFDRK